jgi:hypothetical protein
MAIDPAALFWLDGTRTSRPDQLSAGGMIAPAAITASATPDYSPPGAHTAGIWAIDATVPTSISGIEAPPKGRGRRLVLLNVGAVAITILRNNAASVAANRILMADATHSLDPGQALALHYHPIDARWYLEAPSSTAAPPGPTDVCITRTVSVGLVIAADTTCIQRRPVILAGVGVTIEATGEWLIL